MKFQFILIFLFALTVSCGKSPLLLKKNHETSIISGLESQRLFKSTNQSLQISWLSPLSSSEEAHALIILKKNNIVSDLPNNTKIFLWMPEMGHGSSPIQVSRLGSGLYDLSQIYFIMPGLWQLKIQLFDGLIFKEEIIYEFDIP